MQVDPSSGSSNNPSQDSDAANEHIVDPTRCLEVEGGAGNDSEEENDDEEERESEEGNSSENEDDNQIAQVPALHPNPLLRQPPPQLSFKQQQQKQQQQYSSTDALNPSAKFACQYCQKRFVHKWMMDRHLTSHTGARPYKCISCARRFSLQSSAVRHVKNVHKDSVRGVEASSMVVKEEHAQYEPDGEFMSM